MYVRIQCNWLVIGWVTCIEYHLQHDFHLSYIWYAYSLFWPNIKTLEIFLLEKNFPYVKSGHPLKDEEWEANALSLIVVYLVHFCSELHFQTFEFLHWSWVRGKKACLSLLWQSFLLLYASEITVGKVFLTLPRKTYSLLHHSISFTTFLRFTHSGKVWVGSIVVASASWWMVRERVWAPSNEFCKVFKNLLWHTCAFKSFGLSPLPYALSHHPFPFRLSRSSSGFSKHL